MSILEPILIPKLFQKAPILKQKGAPEGKGRPSISSNLLNENACFSGSRGFEKRAKIKSGSEWKSDAEIERFLVPKCQLLGTFCGHFEHFLA